MRKLVQASHRIDRTLKRARLTIFFLAVYSSAISMSSLTDECCDPQSYFDSFMQLK